MKPQETLYKCPYCDLTSKYACSVKKHIQGQHPNKCKNGKLPHTRDIPMVPIDPIQLNVTNEKNEESSGGISECVEIDGKQSGKKRKAQSNSPDLPESKRMRVNHESTTTKTSDINMGQTNATTKTLKHSKKTVQQLSKIGGKADKIETTSKYKSVEYSNKSNSIDSTTSMNKCPHCNFSCKRASALNFHINMSHPNIKEESDSDDAEDTKVDNDTRIERVSSDKAKVLSPSKSPKGQRQKNSKSSISPKAKPVKEKEKESFHDLDIEEDFDDDRDSDYNPDADSGDPESDDELAIMDKDGKYRCLYCQKLFKEEHSIQQHVNMAHSNLARKKIDAVNDEATNEEKVKTFLCPFCNHISDHKAAILRHVVQHHKIAKEYAQDKVKCYEVIDDAKQMQVESELLDDDPSDASKFAVQMSPTDQRGTINKLNLIRKPSEMAGEAATDNVDSNCDDLDKDPHDNGDVFDNDKLDQSFDENLDSDEEKDSKSLVQKILRNFKCPFCGAIKKYKKWVIKHVEKYHAEEDFDVENIECIRETTFQRQDDDADDEDHFQYMCPYCSLKSRYRCSVSRHIRRYHPDKPPTFPSKRVSRSAMKRESADDGTETTKCYKCNYCAFTGNTRREIKDHIVVGHPEKDMVKLESENTASDAQRSQFRCPFCPMISSWRRNVYTHVKNKHSEHVGFKLQDVIEDNIEEIVVVKEFIKSEYSSLDTDKEADLEDAESLEGVHFKCMYCDLVCQTKHDVQQHGFIKHPKLPVMKLNKIKPVDISVCKAQNRFSCPYCDLSSPWKASICRHVEKMHEEKTDFSPNDVLSEMILMVIDGEETKEQLYFKCPYCDYLSKSKAGVSIHAKYTHPNEPAPSNVEEIMANMSNQKLVNIYKCPHCDFSSQWRGTVRIHLKNHHSQSGHIESASIQCVQVVPGDKPVRKRIFYCPYCSNVSTSKKSILSHIHVVHPKEREHVIRKRTTDGDHDTIQHIKISEGDDGVSGDSMAGFAYKCHICDMAYDFHKSLRYHMRIHHPDVFDAFAALDNAVDIVSTHHPGTLFARGLSRYGRVRKEIQYRCPFCNMLYSWEKLLVSHLRTQHAGKIDSSKKLEDLIDTIRKNAEQSMKLVSSHITCTTCNMFFGSVGALRRHRKLKHRFHLRVFSPSYTCRLCGSRSHTYKSLVRHLLCQHHGRGVRCTQCGHLFFSRYSLGVHQRVVHRSQALTCKYPGCTFRCKWGISMKVHNNSRHSNHNENPGMKCEVCSITLSSLSALRVHISFQHLKLRGTSRVYRSRVYHCNVCKTVFKDQQARNQHMQNVHPEEMQICELCGVKFPTERQLSRHILVHHNESDVDQEQYVHCEVCQKLLFRKRLNHHYLVKHPESLKCDCRVCSSPGRVGAPFTCHSCNRGFCRKLFYTAHKITCHNMAKRIECKFCDLKFSTSFERNNHAHKMHQEDAAEVSMVAAVNPVKPMTFEETDEPGTHVLRIGEDQSQQYLPKLTGASLNAVIKELQVVSKTGSEELPFKCVLCGQCFAKSKYIYLHIKRKHVRDEDKRYRCKVCGMGFVGVNGFRKHSRSHSGFRPYKCKICGKTFKAPASLYEHMHLHDSAKNFRCEICKRTFQQRGAINAHVVRHDLLRPFKCIFCDKGYTTRGELSRHLKRYNKDKKTKDGRSHTCHICLEVFSHFPVLLRHIEMHNPEKPFHCKVCETRFGSYLSMYNHKVKNNHFLSSEMETGDDTEEKTFRKIPMRNMGGRVKAAVTSLLQEQGEEEVKEQQQIYIDAQANVMKPVEVVIESYPSDSRDAGNEVVVAKPLLEIHQYTQFSKMENEQADMQQREDEIMKDMLDADEELLENLNYKETNEPEEAAVVFWETVNDANAVEVKEESTVPEYTVEQEIPSTTAVAAVTEVPNSLEDLATIIARNTNTDEALTAYQTEDGSVIYVCMPNDVAETVDEEGNTGRRLSQLLKKSKRITFKK